MSLFPRFTQDISPLFRLMDDYDRAMRTNFTNTSSTLRSFAPKFDVKELKEGYELHGELPGIEQKDINIEWTDGNTLTISGRSEHSRNEGIRPESKGLIEEDESTKSTAYHQPTVEDESAPAVDDIQTNASALSKTTTSETTKQVEPTSKYWISERSVGEFQRTFSFPTRVDQEAVKASLKNGILSIVVPKSKAPTPRRINIE